MAASALWLPLHYPLAHADSATNILLNGDFSNGLWGWNTNSDKTVWGGRGQYPILEVLTHNPGYSGGHGAPDTCFPSQKTDNPFLNIEVPFGADGYAEQRVFIPTSGGATLSLLSWGWEGSNPALGFSGLVNASVRIVDSNKIEHTLETFTPPPMFTPVGSSSSTTAVCTGYLPVLKSYDLSAYSGQSVKLRLAATSKNCCGTNAFFDDVDLEARGIALHCLPFAGFQANPDACAIPNAVVGVSYSYYFPVTGGVPRYFFDSQYFCVYSCPPGMYLNEVGEIYGTPTQAGVFQLLLKITDSGQGSTRSSASISITLTITPIITNVEPYSGVLPSAGPAKGGTPVNVTGVGFAQGVCFTRGGECTSIRSVRFGGNDVSSGSFHVVNDNWIKVDSAPENKVCSIIIICHDDLGLTNVTVVITVCAVSGGCNDYSSSVWCPTPVNYTTGSPRCNQFNYTQPQQPLLCTDAGWKNPLSTGNLNFGIGSDTGVGIMLSGSISAKPHTHLCSQIDNWNLKQLSFNATIDTSVSLNATISVTASKNNLSNPYRLSNPVQGDPLIIGPVIIVPTLTPVLMYNASAEGAFTLGIKQSTSTTFGINYTQSQGPRFIPLTIKCWDPTTNSTTTLDSAFCIQPTTAASVSASVKVMLGFQFSLLFYDLAGPVVTPDVYLRLDAGDSTTTTEGPAQCDGIKEGTQPGPWAAICGGVEVRLGLQLNPWLNVFHIVNATTWNPIPPWDVKSILLAGSVSISPSPSPSLQPNQTLQFTATVAGTKDKWSPTWDATCGSLSNTTGVTVKYKAPSVGPNTCTLVARMSIFRNLLDSLPCQYTFLPCFTPQVPISILQSNNQVFDYRLSNTGNIKVPQGGSGSTTIIATLSGGSTQLVTLSCVAYTLPYDTYCSIINPYMFPTGSRDLTISTSYSTPAGTFQVRVMGSPSGTTTIPTTFNLTITPVYVPSAPLNPSARGEPGQIEVQWQPPSSDGGFPVRWYGFYRGTSPGDLRLVHNAVSATFFIDRSVDCQLTYYYSITAFNSKGEGPPSLEIHASPLCVTIPSASKSSVDVGQSVTFSTLATGGSAGYTYSWSGMPVGCFSSDAPKVVCTPTEPGDFTVNVTATDSNGFRILSNSLSYTVYADPSVATPTASHSVDVGQSVSFSASASGGSEGYDYTWLDLPTGCTSASTPNLTCTPTRPATFLVAVQATDSNGYSVTSIPLTYTVLSAPSVSVASLSQSPVEVGQSVTFSATASGGSGSYSYSWFGLPSGCQSSNTASLTCTASTLGTYAITVRVTDSNGYRANSAVFTFTVRSSNPPTAIFGLDPMIFYGTLGGVVALIAISAAVAIVRRRKTTSVN